MAFSKYLNFKNFSIFCSVHRNFEEKCEKFASLCWSGTNGTFIEKTPRSPSISCGSFGKNELRLIGHLFYKYCIYVPYYLSKYVGEQKLVRRRKFFNLSDHWPVIRLSTDVSTTFFKFGAVIFKIQLFWEGHTNLKRLPLCFDVTKYIIKKK